MQTSEKQRLPKIASFLLKRIPVYSERHSILDDFEETFEEIKQESGLTRAYLWCWFNLLTAFPEQLRIRIKWGLTMLRNYFIISVRNLVKYKGFAFINISGLATGMACFILLFTFIENERKFDSFHQNLHRIHRVILQYDTIVESVLMAPLGQVLADEYTDFEHVVRFTNMTGVVLEGDERFSEEVFLADKAFFEMFSFELKYGSGESVLDHPHQIVLSSEMYMKYFDGDGDPVGKTISMKFGDVSKEFVVSGVVNEISRQSSIRFSFVIPFENVGQLQHRDNLHNWDNFEYNIFVQFLDGITPEYISSKMSGTIEKYFAGNMRQMGQDPEKLKFIFQPFADYHLGEVRGGNGLEEKMDAGTVRMLLIIAFLILSIACFNFMNLSLGNASSRLKEIGVRKFLGAARSSLIKQFWFESVMTSMLALFSGILIAFLLLPVFNGLTERNLTLFQPVSGIQLIMIFLLVLFTGIAAGSYPAFLLSKVKLHDILRQRFRFGGSNILTRMLIVIQFALSIVLIVSSFVMNDQFTFIKDKYPGYSNENVTMLSLGGSWRYSQKTENDYYILKEQLSKLPGIESISGTSAPMMWGLSSTDYKKGDKEIEIFRYKVDANFIDFMQMELIAGRNFNPEMQTDFTNAIIVNETFVRETGLEGPINYRFEGKRLSPLNEPVIIGVVRDFHFASMKRMIEPAMIYLNNATQINYILLKTDTEITKEFIPEVKKVWYEIIKDKPFSPYYVDQIFEWNYRETMKWISIVSWSSIIAIVISCMGLFGLVTLVITRRTKEIGIRRVVGAGTGHILYVINRDFLKLISVASIFALPAGYFIMGSWLENFAYKAELGPMPYITTLLLVFLTAILTLSWHTVRSARKNPVDSLRYE